jgi:DNA-binding transcriptional LysR family regulator
MLDSTFLLWNDYGMFDLADLRAFARIADLGSISGTARALRMPKSSVSRALVRLENAIGAVLVERSTRHLRLTDAGLLLQRHARRILDDVGEAENAIGGLIGHPQGDLRVSVPFTFAAGPLAKALPRFLASYPDVRVLLTIDNRIVDLLVEEYDVAIRIGPLADSDLIARRLTTFELFPCASPAYLREHPLISLPADLASQTIIGHRARRESWSFLSAKDVKFEVEVETRTVVPEPDVARTMLAAGAGIGILPDFLAAELIASDRLIRVLPDHQHRAVDVHALYPSHRSLSAKVRVFIDALASYLSGRDGKATIET